MTVNLLMTEGFDMYNGTGPNIGAGALWGFINNSAMAMVGGRFGGQGFQIGHQGGSLGQIYRIFDGAGATMSASFGFAMYVPGFGVGFTAFQVDNNSLGALCSFGYTSTGAIWVASGSGGTRLCTSVAGVLPVSTWVFFEFEIVFSATVGSVNVYMNGAAVAGCSVSGVNTLAAGGGASIVHFWGQAGATNDLIFDDVYVVGGASRPGNECRIETLRPAADNLVNFTPSSGSNNFSRVNDSVVDGDGSYVQTASTNVRDLYSGTALSSSPSSIYGLTIVGFAEKTDAITRQLYLSGRSGSTDSDGAAFNLAASYGRFDRILNVDPNTSAAWTTSGVNNLLYGPKAA